MYGYRVFAQALYALKQQYGQSVQVTVRKDVAINARTGAITTTDTVYNVRCVAAPPSTARRALGPSVGSNMPAEAIALIAIIAYEDLPSLEFFERWYFQIDGVRYSPVTVTKLAIGAPIVFCLRACEGM